MQLLLLLLLHGYAAAAGVRMLMSPTAAAVATPAAIEYITGLQLLLNYCNYNDSYCSCFYG